ncbi:MAG: YncE family protein [Bacteroidales bacterium]|nr:YncE family protein [Bacteroidales bacterium]
MNAFGKQIISLNSFNKGGFFRRFSQTLLIIISSLIILFSSCKPKPVPEQEIDISEGVFIVNEGNFMSNNGEISFYNTQTGEIINNLYALQNNNAVLGDVVQSMCISDTLALISVNNSKKIEIVNIKDFKHVHTITGLSYPRYIITVRENICYLTNGKNPGEIKVIDTDKKEVIKTITAGNQPENLLLSGNKVFVANGAWGHDSTVSIINPSTDELIETINVGDGATDLASDKNGNIWVLCQGKSAYDYPEETASQLVCINPDTYEIIERVNIGITGDNFHPVRIASDKENGYIYYNERVGVYRININNPHHKEWFSMLLYYGLEVNPVNGNVYMFSDKGFTEAGTMDIYNKEGEKLQELVKVGVGPNCGVFYKLN